MEFFILPGSLTGLRSGTKMSSFSPGVGTFHARVAGCRIQLLSGLTMATVPVLAVAFLLIILCCLHLKPGAMQSGGVGRTELGHKLK